MPLFISPAGTNASYEEFGVSGPFQRPKLNFVQAGATSITVADDVGNDKVTVTISSTDTNTDSGAGLFGGVSPSQTSNAANGTFTFLNQGNVRWGVSFAVGANVGVSANFAGFGICKGTGGSTAHATLDILGVFVNNGASGGMWQAGRGSGSVAVFGGSSYIIGFQNLAGNTTTCMASAVGW